MKLFIFTILTFSSVFVLAQVQLTVPKYSGEMMAVINANKRIDAEIANKKLKEKQQAAMDQSLAGAITSRERDLSDFEISQVREVEALGDFKLSFPSHCKVVSVQLRKYPGQLKNNWKFRVINSKGKMDGKDVKYIGNSETDFVADLLKIRNLSSDNSKVCFDQSYQAAVDRYFKTTQEQARQAEFLKKFEEPYQGREKKGSASKSKVD